MKSGILYAVHAAVLSAFVSCSVGPVQETETSGMLEICVSNAVDTRASAADGDVMNTLSVWLAKSDGSVVASSFTTPDAVVASVRFENILRGDYKLYLVSNCKALDGETSSVSSFPSVTYGQVTSGNAPDFSGGMPCSLCKDISVGPGRNKVSASLVRVAGRITMTVRNGVQDKDIFIARTGLSDRNRTSTYLFGKEDHSATGEDVAFPEMSVPVRIPAGSAGEVNVYDTYLFETSPESSGVQMSVRLYGAMYPSGTMSADMVDGSGYSAGNNTGSVATGQMYLIRSAFSEQYYMGVENGALVLKQFSSDLELKYAENLKNYCWRFSSTGGGTIINVGTGSGIQLSRTTASAVTGTGTSFTKTGSGPVKFYYRSGRTSYYLTNSNNSVAGTSTSSDACNWYLRNVTETGETVKTFNGAEKTFTRLGYLHYIDDKGIRQPLCHICRNEHVKIPVNIYFNEELGSFDFEVEPWDKRENSTSFD